MRAAIYARVSTHDKGQDPESQLAEMREYCKRMGWEIYREYVDYESGSKAGREEFQEMLNDARLKRFDILLVWKLDRLARSIKQLIETLDNLRAWNIEFKCITQDIDTTTPHGKLLFHIIAAFAEFERELIRDRVKAGIAKAKKKGIRVGRPPRKLEGEILERILNDRDKGMSYGQLSKKYRIPKSTLYTILKGVQKTPSEA